jgi:catechol 2,3-dioxygenase-like lactoylglutathione lyase family enzyme
VKLDHLVVAARDLEAGADFVEGVLGVRPQGSGKHEFMGTHNRLLRLGDVYLEVIAVDADAPKPSRARWFELDAFDGSPRLMHWVARTTDIETLVARSLEPLGAITQASRGDLRWRITVPDDGHLPGQGIVPTLIQWDGAHPVSRLPDTDCRLVSLEATHPEPERIARALESIGATVFVTRGDAPRLRATISSPRGVVVLE